MKQVPLLLILFLSFSLQAQDTVNNSNTTKGKCLKLSPKMLTTINKFSVMATLGTPSLSTKDISTISMNKVASVSLADLNVSYKMTPRLSFGIDLMGNLGNCTSGYYTAEGTFTAFSQDDDDDEFDDDDLDELDDDDLEEEHEDEDCDEDEMGNLMGSATYKLSEKFPLFIQAAAGYSFENNAPAYTTMIGYNQKVCSNLGIVAGIRYSDVLHKRPADAISVTPSSGFKFELGLSWNL